MNELTQNVKAFVFDWDGTLVDTCGLILDAHNHVRKYMGQVEWTMDDFLGRASQSAREYYPQVYGDRAEEAQAVLYDFVLEKHLEYMKVIPSAKEILDYLKAQNMTMAVVSNKRHDVLIKEIKTLGWMDYFEVIVGAGEAEKDKPSEIPLLLALSRLDTPLNPSEILYIGDTETDLLCGKNAKAKTVLVQSDKPRPDLIEKYAPYRSYTALNDFVRDVMEIKEPNAA